MEQQELAHASLKGLLVGLVLSPELLRRPERLWVASRLVTDPLLLFPP